MSIVTLEEHFTTSDYIAALERAGIHDMAGPAMQRVRPRLLDVGAGRLADMDAAGIDIQVLSLVGLGMDRLDAATATTLARDTNDYIADAVRAHPDRFAALATVAMQDPAAAAREIERAVTQRGCRGVMINGTTNGRFLDDPVFTPVLEATQALGVPIYLHPASPPPAVQQAYYSGLPDPLGMLLSISGWGWHTETGLHSLRLILAGVFDRFPRLQIIIGHMGEDLPYSLARADAVMSPAAAGLLSHTVAEYFHAHFHVTTSGYFTVPPFLCALSVVGADRLLFSVDYPFSDNRLGRTFLDALPVAPADHAKIAATNARKLLRLSPRTPGP